MNKRLFNILVKQNDKDNEFVKIMENTYLNYSYLARKELDFINDNKYKKILEELTNMESIV